MEDELYGKIPKGILIWGGGRENMDTVSGKLRWKRIREKYEGWSVCFQINFLGENLENK